MTTRRHEKHKQAVALLGAEWKGKR